MPRGKDTEVKNIFTGLSISTVAVGFCSSCQGILSGILIGNNTPILQVLSFASFTTICIDNKYLHIFASSFP